MKTALITGITGQDGSYLAELLLGKGYVVHGLIRRSSSFNTGRIDHILDRLHLHHGDMLDASGLAGLVSTIEPDEVYNLAAQSHVRVSFEQPVYTAETIAIGTLNLLEAIRSCRDRTHNDVRFYQASSSELFGRASAPQSELTPFRPCSPYATAKTHAFWDVVNCREGYGIFACNGILFNHESPRRGETFVTRKITRAATRIKLGLQKRLLLGNLQAKRDWGFAGEYVAAMWLMLQADIPDDFVIATGKSYSIEHLARLAFLRLDLAWEDYVEFDQRYTRPVEVPELRGDARKADSRLGWSAKTDIVSLCNMMVDSDLELAKREGLDKRECPS